MQVVRYLIGSAGVAVVVLGVLTLPFKVVAANNLDSIGDEESCKRA
jgi:hypothetical protein